ncbi:MAG TPA: PAS domain S-box protein [Gemmatimonadales bacterium]|nr:PAS domain S-box protein [Gemmatimonadales bacterium]
MVTPALLASIVLVHVPLLQFAELLFLWIAVAVVAGLLLLRVVRLARALRTERAEVRAAAKTLEALVDASPLAIFLVDEDSRVRDVWNPAAERLFGWSRGEVEGTVPAILRPTAGEAETGITRQRVRAREVVTGLRRSGVRRDGRPIELAIATAPVGARSGARARLLVMVEDVTDRVAADARLAAQAALIENVQDPIIAVDPAFRITLWNPAAERLYGWSAAEAVGQVGPELLRIQAVMGDGGATPGAIRAAGAFEGEVIHHHRDGTPIRVEARARVLRDGEGRVTGWVASIRDVTRERALDEQLRQAQKMEAIGQLTGGIAHDFNNLLTIILANTALLRDLRGPGEDYLHDIQAAARRGSELVRKLLAFGRRERLDLVPLHLERVAEEFLGTLRRLLPENVVVRLGPAADLPPVRADRGAIEQILLNLVTNARDAMPEGGEVTIAFAAEAPDSGPPTDEAGCVILTVRDEGTGMDGAVAARVFEPFFTTKPTGRGTGLGMAMVYGLMQQHGGTVELESEPGRGTEVRLWFPATRDWPAEPPASGAPPASPGRGETILLAEDEAPLRRAAVRILEGLGYRVLAASDGSEALELLAAHQAEVALVITDVAMPRLSGPDLLDALRSRGARMPVLFATGYTAPRFLPADPGVRFLEKPWSVEELARVVREALDGAAPA